MKPNTTIPIDPTVRTAEDYRQIDRLDTELGIYHLFKNSRFAFLRSASEKAQARKKEIETYLERRVHAALGSTSYGFSPEEGVVQRFMMVTGDTSRKIEHEEILKDFRRISGLP